MRPLTQLFAGGVASAAFLSGLAFAEDLHKPVALKADLTQVQTADVTGQSTIDVNLVEESANAALAGANSLTADATKAALLFEADQQATGASKAEAATRFNRANAVSTTANALANGFVATATDDSIAGQLTQKSEGAARAVATSQGCAAGQAVTAATASGSGAQFGVQRGGLYATIIQDQTGTVSADARQMICETGQGAASAAATGAAVAALVDTGETGLAAVQNVGADSAVTARSEGYANAAGDLVVGASAGATTVTLDASFGPAEFLVVQNSAAHVRAEGYATVRDGWTGTVAASSYGVGNSAVASNRGASLTMDVAQSQTGLVEAYSALAGGAGAVGVSSATAMGNYASGMACMVCGPASLSASLNQVNVGEVRAGSTIAVSSARALMGQASAIGNAATFTVGQPKH